MVKLHQQANNRKLVSALETSASLFGGRWRLHGHRETGALCKGGVAGWGGMGGSLTSLTFKHLVGFAPFWYAIR